MEEIEERNLMSSRKNSNNKTTEDDVVASYAAVLISQGRHRFFSIAMPSDILAQTCFVSNRYDDPIEGFQRSLNKTRAQEIADYIDEGLGTIPTAIILSAQEDAEFEYISSSKTLSFKKIPKAFLILDGQHRVYGFTLANMSVRVPVIVYNGLSRRDETRLFIDINTKQRPVPNELLLDIKSLADYESDLEGILRAVFDLFYNEPDSSLEGYLSAAEKSKSKISRVTFNAALKPHMKIFVRKDSQEIYEILNLYISVFKSCISEKDAANKLTNPYVFRAMIAIFPEIAQRVKDRYGSYHINSFNDVVQPMFDRMSVAKLNKRHQGHKELQQSFSESLKEDFTL